MIVVSADPASTPKPVLPTGRSNLALRVASSVVLAPLAVVAAYIGGVVFLLFWTAAALIVLWEWDALVCAHDKNPVLTIGSVAIVGACVLAALDRAGFAILFLALGMMGVATLASRIRRAWCAAGVTYAGAILIAPVLLRHDAALGFAGMLFLFAVVWCTDIVAYFVGRAFGGPKLMPRVSPNKTWSGALGGTVAAIAGGIAVAHFAGIGNIVAIGALALVLSIVSQAGDLFESALKRRFDVKDASNLLPGHGGLMDRLDGFVTAVAAAALIGVVRGGLEMPARGLLVW
jgi:phosphatidate cytidylyltransferase